MKHASDPRRGNLTIDTDPENFTGVGQPDTPMAPLVINLIAASPREAYPPKTDSEVVLEVLQNASGDAGRSGSKNRDSLDPSGSRNVSKNRDGKKVQYCSHDYLSRH